MMHHIVLSAFDKQVKDAKKAFKDYEDKTSAKVKVNEKIMIQSEEQKEYNAQQSSNRRHEVTTGNTDTDTYSKEREEIQLEFDFKWTLNRTPY